MLVSDTIAEAGSTATDDSSGWSVPLKPRPSGVRTGEPDALETDELLLLDETPLKAEP